MLRRDKEPLELRWDGGHEIESECARLLAECVGESSLLSEVGCVSNGDYLLRVVEEGGWSLSTLRLRRVAAVLS